MYPNCLFREEDTFKRVNDHNGCNLDFSERFSNKEKYFNKPKKIPIKIILSEYEEITSTENNTEPFDFNSCGNLSPSINENLTNNFIKFSNANSNNYSLGKNS